jgi:pimeloyl-ACP methyl ester carboxylesterase
MRVERMLFDDVELRFELRGQGPHVVLVHAAPFVSWYDPLVKTLPDCSTLTYRRHLIRSSDDPYRPVSVAEDAATCVRLLDYVGWDRAHVVGHSYGALVGLQLALDAANHVASVALLEPAARGISSAEAVVAALQPVFAAYRSGDREAAVDRFLTHVCGEGYRSPLEHAVAGAFDEAMREADLFFQAEMAAVRQFSFGPDDAARVDRPVLNVLGTESVRRFVEGSELVQSWFPGADRLSVPGAGHLLMVQNPRAVADGLRQFWARYPIDHTERSVPHAR